MKKTAKIQTNYGLVNNGFAGITVDHLGYVIKNTNETSVIRLTIKHGIVIVHLIDIAPNNRQICSTVRHTFIRHDVALKGKIFGIDVIDRDNLAQQVIFGI